MIFDLNFGWPWKKEKQVVSSAYNFPENISTFKRKKLEYNFELILNVMEGQSIQGKTTKVLERLKTSYGYYYDGDLVVYWDKVLQKRLIEEGVSTYNDSSNNLIITTSPVRVKSQLENE
jgi:predicted ATPase